MAFSQITLKADYYSIFDRTGEDVMFKFMVTYDKEDILKNDINCNNFFVTYLGMDNGSIDYVKSIGASVDVWHNKMIESLEADSWNGQPWGQILDLFFEEVSEDFNEAYFEAFPDSDLSENRIDPPDAVDLNSLLKS